MAMGVTGKTCAERAAYEDVETKVRRLLDAVSVLKKSADEIGKLILSGQCRPS